MLKMRAHLLEGILIAVFVSAILYFYAPLLRHGRYLPSRPPEEADRVHHPAGFSLIVPGDWKSLIMEGEGDGFPPAINANPGDASRYAPVINVRILGRKDFAAAVMNATFQRQPAREEINKGNVGDNYPMFSYSLTFERNGTPFQLSYTTFTERDSVPKEIRQYLETFQYVPKK